MKTERSLLPPPRPPPANSLRRVLTAQAPVQATSTITFTSHSPLTSTVTFVASDPAAAAGSPSSSPTTALVPPPPAGSSALPVPAIAGIAVGSTVFALAVCTLIIALIKWRQRKARQQVEYENTSLGLGGHHSYEPGRGYGVQRPPLSHFLTVDPAHHRASHARSTSGYTGSTVAGAGTPGSDGALKFQQQQMQQQRASVVSSSNYSDQHAHGPVEVSADEVHRYEVDAASPRHSPGDLPTASPPPVESPGWLGGGNAARGTGRSPPQGGFYRDF